MPSSIVDGVEMCDDCEYPVGEDALECPRCDAEPFEPSDTYTDTSLQGEV